MQITFDTSNDNDRAMLASLLELQLSTSAVPKKDLLPHLVTEPAAPAPKKAEPKKAAVVIVEKEAGDDPADATMADAVAAATQVVSSGGAAKVKAALVVVGAKRVSEMKTEDIPAFLASLES